jgi:hypothetical protein
MIKYEINNSPFFIANKNYCETTESKLKTINIDCSGWCNSYGYDIEATFKKNNLIYNIKFHRHQSTQNGVIIPVDALDYAGIELIVTGMNKKFSVIIGKSSLRRFFISKAFKDKIPSPYFIKFNYLPDANFIDNLVLKIQDDKISKFKLCNGILLCKIHTASTDLLDLIADIEKTTKNWA